MKIVQMKRLPNGIPVYFQPDPESHTVSIIVKHGSANDPVACMGRSHVFEHWGANSTRRFPNRSAELMARECSANYWRQVGIRTDFTSTAYGCGLLLRRKYILDLFPLFAEMVRFPQLDAVALEAEKAAIITEFALMGEDSPEDHGQRVLLQTIYSTNPVRNRIDCDPRYLLSVTSEALREFFATHYISGNIAIVILGPKREKALRMAARRFGDMPTKEAPPLNYDMSDTRPELNGRVGVELDKPGLKTFHIFIGFPTDPWGSDFDEALDVLGEILEFRIEDVLRDQNTNITLGTYHPLVLAERTRFHGLFSIWVPTVSLDGARRAEEVILKEIERIKHGGFLNSEIEAAVAQLPETRRRTAEKKLKKRLRDQLSEETIRLKRPIRDFYTDAFRNQPHVLAELIAEHFCNEADPNPGRLNDSHARVVAVTKRDIIQAAQEYLPTDRYACVLLKPTEPINFDVLRA